MQLINTIKEKPYHLFLIFAVFFSILSLFHYGNSTIDIQMHDVYFVVGHDQVFFWIFILLFLYWMIYLLCRKFLWSNKLSWIHTILTIFCFALIFILGTPLLSGYVPNDMLKRYYSFYEVTNTAITSLTIIMVLAQPLFLINILGGFIKNKLIVKS